MAQSEMGEVATATDRLTGTIPLTPATPIHVARAHLRNTGEPAAVVFRSGRPVGVATAAALTAAHTASGADAPISTVMDLVTVPVKPGSDANETVRTFTQAAWDWLKQTPPGADGRWHHGGEPPLRGVRAGQLKRRYEARCGGRLGGFSAPGGASGQGVQLRSA